VRFHDLRRILQPIVLAGFPVAGAGCVEAVIDTDCVDTVDATYRFDTPADDLSLQFDIERCRVDVDACKDLCREALQRHSLSHEPTSCRVSFTETSVSIHVSYEVFSGGDGCPIELVRDAALELPDEPQVHGLAARTLDRIWNAPWNGGRTCHA